MSVLRRLTTADVDSVVNLVRTRLLTALDNERELFVLADAGITETTKPSDTNRTFEPDGRFSIEIHIGGGVDRANHERPRMLR